MYRYIWIITLSFSVFNPLLSVANETSKLEFIPNKNIFPLSCETSQEQIDLQGKKSYGIRAESGILVFVELKDIKFRKNLSATVVYESGSYSSAVPYLNDTIISAFYFDNQSKFKQQLDIYSKKATTFKMRIAYVRPNAELSKNLDFIQATLLSDNSDFEYKLVTDALNGVSSASLEQDPPVDMNALCPGENPNLLLNGIK
jgi:hypothetical protein